MKKILLGMLILMISSNMHAEDISQKITYRPSTIHANQIGVVYFQDDKNSSEIARYYAESRHIPKENLIGIQMLAHQNGRMSAESFAVFKTTVEKRLNNHINVVVFMWQKPFAVSCNAITSAFTMGFDADQCLQLCGPGKKNPIFNNGTRNPFRTHHLRLSMLLPTDNLTLAKTLIDRGVMSNFQRRPATGYFLITKDNERSRPRQAFFPEDYTTVNNRDLSFRTLHAEHLQNKQDIMFYFTGQTHVNDLNTLEFLPGAIADHLTSSGGVLDPSNTQMSALAWLEAGATGSYGTVSEPCNYWQKFPNPAVLLSHYLAGETLIEAYWKSVMWPAQGLFIGEPLAAPYRLSSSE